MPSDGGKMNSKVFFYSERGLLNCLVLDLKSDPEKTKDFFKLIKFGMDEQRPNWVDKVESVDWYVEFSASEFGNPDLIADIHCTDGHRVIFFEAKLKSYEKAASSMDTTVPFEPNENNEYPDGIYKNKSSSINAQLALRYRLAQRLNNLQWLEIRSSDEPRIEETFEDAVFYHDMFNAIREVHTGRRIHNRKMIEILDKITANRPDFYFVAMTFESQDHILQSIQEHSPNLLPPIGLAKWRTSHNQFGLLNFNDLIRAFDLKSNSYLALSREYINFYSQNNADATVQEEAFDEEEQEEAKREELSSKDLYIQSGKADADVYVKWFEQLRKIAGSQFKDYKTSCSIVKSGETIIKLMYKNNNVFIGFRNKLPDTLNDNHSIVISIQGKQFVSVLANTVNVEIIRSFFTNH